MSLINVGVPLRPLWEDALLVYWRANDETKLYPNDPLALLVPGVEVKMVLAVMGLKYKAELPCSGAAAIHEAMQCLFHPTVSGGRKVVTLHARSLLGRLARWHALRTGVDLPSNLQPPYLVDLVEMVNAPAVLAYQSRVAFRLSDYTELLQLKPEPGFDHETGTLFNLLTRYGN
jgi:hypothetical protein